VLPATAKVFYLEPKLGTPSLHADHMVDTAHGPPPQYKQHTNGSFPAVCLEPRQVGAPACLVLHEQAPRNDPMNRKPETWSVRRLPDFDRCTPSACRLKSHQHQLSAEKPRRTLGACALLVLSSVRSALTDDHSLLMSIGQFGREKLAR
jgi:hypothetical protein